MFLYYIAALISTSAKLPIATRPEFFSLIFVSTLFIADKFLSNSKSQNHPDQTATFEGFDVRLPAGFKSSQDSFDRNRVVFNRDFGYGNRSLHADVVFSI